jgi:hypothetical protein
VTNYAINIHGNQTKANKRKTIKFEIRKREKRQKQIMIRKSKNRITMKKERKKKVII